MGEFRVIITAFLLCSLAACDDARPPAAEPPTAPTAPAVAVIGSRGTADGQFSKPRVVALGPRGNLCVVDMTGRIQRFSSGGAFACAWRTPENKLGNPTGVCFDRTGCLFVADTHYNRVLKYAPDTKLVMQFGVYGTGKGEFVYPTDVVVDDAGHIYVSEYGDGARIQVFDRGGRFLREWGRTGEAPGEFRRPMGLAISADGVIYVADACNHRIQTFTRQGKVLGGWGRLGTGPGELKYPYDVAVATDGVVYVCEYGNNRIQKFSRDGRPLEPSQTVREHPPTGRAG